MEEGAYTPSCTHCARSKMPQHTPRDMLHPAVHIGEFHWSVSLYTEPLQSRKCFHLHEQITIVIRKYVATDGIIEQGHRTATYTE